MLQACRARRGNDSFTKLLLHFDGADGSTTFTDSAASKTVTANGNAQIDTAQSKFGGASALFDGTVDWLSLANSTDWNLGAAGSGDFTIDFWVRFNSVSGTPGFVGTWAGTGAGGYQFYYTASGIHIWTGSGTDRTFSTAWTPSTGVWYHIAFVRSGSTTTVYVDGVSKGTVADGDFNNDGNVLTIGSASTSTGYELNGWLDEFRLSKGIARWTANFTPPVYQYSRGGKASSPSFAMAA